MMYQVDFEVAWLWFVPVYPLGGYLPLGPIGLLFPLLSPIRNEVRALRDLAGQEPPEPIVQMREAAEA